MFFLLEKVHHLMPSLDISHVNRSRSKRALLFVLLEKQSKSVLLGPTLEPPHWPIIFVVYGTRTFESVGLSRLPFAFWWRVRQPLVEHNDSSYTFSMWWWESDYHVMFQAKRVFAYLFCSSELNYLNIRFKIRGKRKNNNLMSLEFFFFFFF